MYNNTLQMFMTHIKVVLGHATHAGLASGCADDFVDARCRVDARGGDVVTHVEGSLAALNLAGLTLEDFTGGRK